MISYTYKFEGLYGVIHSLNIEIESDDLSISYELLELAEKSFIEAKEILENKYSEFSQLEPIEPFPDELLVNMVMYYRSNGKYKNIILNYNITTSFEGVTLITMRLANNVHSNMTGKDISRLTFHRLREPLWWEDYEKEFYHLEHNVQLIRSCLDKKAIMKCYYYDKVYFFNIGIKEPDITEDMIEEASWFLYTWKEV